MPWCSGQCSLFQNPIVIKALRAFFLRVALFVVAAVLFEFLRAFPVCVMIFLSINTKLNKHVAPFCGLYCMQEA
jgi:hypothetical protein